jgi:hypothetical protein
MNQPNEQWNRSEQWIRSNTVLQKFLFTYFLSSFFTYFLLTFIFFWNFKTVNSKIGSFGIRTGPIPPVFTEFWKIRPVFLTLEETTFHLFFSCPFGGECWRHLNTNWNLVWISTLWWMMLNNNAPTLSSWKHSCWGHGSFGSKEWLHFQPGQADFPEMEARIHRGS